MKDYITVETPVRNVNNNILIILSSIFYRQTCHIYRVYQKNMFVNEELEYMNLLKIACKVAQTTSVTGKWILKQGKDGKIP